ncbi:MAG: porin family protein [Flavobacteriales bacterium]|jgi:hypothetical protein
MRILKVFILVILSLSSYAQAEFSGGLIAGGVTSQVSGDALAGWDKFGVTGGAWVHVGFNESWGTWVGLQYLPKGSVKPADPDNGDFNQFAFKLNYIEMPVMATNLRGKWRFGIGPSFGFLISQKQEFNGLEYDINPEFKALDISGSLSVTRLIGNKFSLELRGNTSILPTRPAPAVVNPLSYYERGNYNQVLLLALHYRF